MQMLWSSVSALQTTSCHALLLTASEFQLFSFQLFGSHRIHEGFLNPVEDQQAKEEGDHGEGDGVKQGLG